ncbi:hypothetical protein XENOCAPTIV_019791 [Xenoophorus captivus]|uniref:Uncharacterized protein n=1 Tax=Xenoophorus captivus TaxID=1517983 RepID=A0ABV0RRM9_9TELE
MYASAEMKHRWVALNSCLDLALCAILVSLSLRCGCRVSLLYLITATTERCPGRAGEAFYFTKLILAKQEAHPEEMEVHMSLPQKTSDIQQAQRGNSAFSGNTKTLDNHC